MVRVPLLGMAAAAVCLAGCSHQQKVEASGAVDRAGHELRQAVGSAKQALGNDALAAKVKTALNASDRVNTSAIHVVAKRPMVYLQGAVADATQNTLAVRIAKDTVGAGVKVVDQLKVQPQSSRAHVPSPKSGRPSGHAQERQSTHSY